MKVRLSQTEQKGIMYLNSISKICLFEGHGKDIYTDVRARTLKLLEMNPWLASRLVKEKKEVMMEFDETKTPVELVDQILFEDNELCLDDSMDYAKMLKVTSRHVVCSGKKLLKTNDFVIKITLFSHKINNSSGVAVLFSISHVVADGYTYYKLLNAFFDLNQMTAMNYHRKLDLLEQMDDYVGQKNSAFTSSIVWMIQMARNLIFGKRKEYFSRFIDVEKISALKEIYLKDKESIFPFISTNDIITSSHANTTNSRLCLSTIHFRERIAGMNGEDAGNYESFLFLDKEHYQTPEAIRKTLTSKGHFKTNNGVLPSVLEALGCNITVITNAAGFINDYKLGDLRQILHIPIFSETNIPFDCAVIYKAKEGRLAILYLGKRTSSRDYIKNTQLAETVCQSLFK